MKNRIVTLVDNCVYGHHLKAEHGLSLYVEWEDKKILFDTGSTDIFLQNALQLGIDLRDVDYLVLSHGHSDHTGGLSAFMSYNDKARIVCKKGVFNPKFKGSRENGIIHVDQLDLKRFEFVNQLTELIPGLFVFPDLKITDERDTHFDHFDVICNGKRVPDHFEDEQALVLLKENDLTVLSACSHRGITNILSSVLTAFPHKHLSMVIGGYHIHLAGPDKSDVIANYFMKYPDCRVGVCHCTGVDQFARLYMHLGDRAFYNHVGLQLSL